MSETEKLERIARLLEEIRDGQKIQLDRQSETLTLQKEQFQRTQKLQDRAEVIQDRSAQLVGRLHRVMPFVLAVVVILIAYVS